MKDKALLLTINSTGELTGGGIYARTILNGLLGVFSNVYTIEKKICPAAECNEINRTRLEKTLMSDFISRIFLCPSFYFFYIFKIISLIKRNEIKHVFFHNSRLGLIVLFVRLFTNDINLYGLSDNQEAKLSLYQFKKSKSASKKIIRLVDYILICFSEFLFFRFCSKCSFITKEDSLHCNAKFKFILPVCLPEYNRVLKVEKDIDYLFTGSFFFEPNVDALNKMNDLAKLHPNAVFAVAGGGLNNLLKEISLEKNIYIYDSPSDAEMTKIFSRAKAYVSLVEDGSGMKTKLAEALSFGLYVFSSRHSAIGYDEIFNTNVIFVYDDMSNDFIKWSHSLPSFPDDAPLNVFNEFFTYKRSTSVIDIMVTHE
jgi:glycosyltransferase involved in cell wall biosynthesis